MDASLVFMLDLVQTFISAFATLCHVDCLLLQTTRDKEVATLPWHGLANLDVASVAVGPGRASVIPRGSNGKFPIPRVRGVTHE